MAQALTLAAKVTADVSGFTGSVVQAREEMKALGATAAVTDGQLKAAAANDAAAVADLKSAMEDLRRSYDPLYAARQRTIQQQELVDAALAAEVISTQEAAAWTDTLSTKLHGLSPAGQAAAAAARDLATAHDEATAAAAKEADAVQALKDRLDPVAAKQREAAASTELWTKWAAEGKISQDELRAATGQLESEIARMQATANGASRNSPWWMNSNITRNWLDVMQQLVATGGQIQFAIPSIIDAADVTNYYREEAQRAAGAAGTMGHAVQDAGNEAADAAGGLEAAAAGSDLVRDAAAGASGRVGAARAAFAALSGTAVVVGGVVAVLAGAVIAGSVAWYSHTESVEAVTRAHQVVGGTLALTADQMAAMAAQAANAGEISVSAARDMQIAFISTRSVGAEAMETLIGLSRDWAEITGGDVADAGKALAQTFAEPKAAVDALDKQFNLLTATEREQITTLVDHGKKSEAQALLADKLKERIQGLHKDAVNPLTKAFETLGRIASNAWDAVGAAMDRAIKGQPEAAKLADKVAERNSLQAKLDAPTRSSEATADHWTAGIAKWIDSNNAASVEEDKKRLAQLDQEIAAIRGEIDLTKQLADERAKAEKSRSDGKVAADDIRAVNAQLVRQEQLEAEIARIQAGGDSADPAAAGLAGKTLSRKGQEWADIQEATAAGKSIAQMRDAKMAANEARAAAMDPAIGKPWLAQQQAIAALYGTETDAVERATAGEIARTSALAQQTAALTAAVIANDAELAGANAIATAYSQSTAEGLRAEAMVRALAAAQSLGEGAAWAQAEAQRQLMVDLANTRAEAEQSLRAIAEETASTAALTEAIAGGVDEEMYAQVGIQAQQMTKAWADRAAALTDEMAKAKELADLEAYRATLVTELTEGALEKRRQNMEYELRDMRSSLALSQAELSVAGLTGAERTRTLTVLQAQLELQAKGIDLASAQADEYIRLKLATAETNTLLERANALKGVFDEAAKSLSSGFREAVEGGIDDVGDFAAETLDIIKDLRLDIADQLVFTPVINAIVGYSYTDTMSALGITTNSQTTTASGTTATGATGTTAATGLVSGNSLSSASLWLAGNSGSTGIKDFLGSTAFSYGGTLDDTANALVNETTVSVGNIAGAALSGISAIMSFSEGKYISGIADTISTVLAFTPLAWAAPIVSIAGTVLETLFGDLLYGDEDHANAGMQFVSGSGGDVSYVGSYALDGAEETDWDAAGNDISTLLSEAVSAIGGNFDSTVLAGTNGQAWIGYDEGWDGSGSGYYLTYDPVDYKDHGDTVQWFDSADAAASQLLRDMVSSGSLGTLDEDVVTAAATSTATTLEDLLADIEFGYNFDYVNSELNRDNIGTQDSVELAVAQDMADTLSWISEFKATTSDLGLDSAAADSSTRTYVEYMVGISEAPDDLTDVQVAWMSLEATFSDSNLTPLLEEVGLSAYSAADLLASAEDEIRADYVAGLEQTLSGETWWSDLQSLSDWADAERTNVETIGAGADQVQEILETSLAALVTSAGGGAAAITDMAAAVPELADELDALAETLQTNYRDALAADLNGLQDRDWLNAVPEIADWWADTQVQVAGDAVAAALANEVLSASLGALFTEAGGVTAAIGDMITAAPEMAEQITTAAADWIAASEDVAAAAVDLVSRAQTALGDDLASTLTGLDYEQTQTRAEYTALGLDTALIDAVLAAERAQAVQDHWTDAADAQIAKFEDTVSGLDALAEAMAGATAAARDLQLDDALTTLSPWEQLAAIRQDYGAAKALANDTSLADADRAEAIADFTAVAQDRAAEERDYWGDALQYNAAFEAIQTDLLAFAGDQAAEVASQSELLRGQLSELEAVRDSITAASDAEQMSADALAAQLTTAHEELIAALATLETALATATTTTAIASGATPTGYAAFDETRYLAENPDVKAAVDRGEITAQAHYIEYGQFEGRGAYGSTGGEWSTTFDAGRYLEENPDVADAVARGETTAYDHYTTWGADEDRPAYTTTGAGYALGGVVGAETGGMVANGTYDRDSVLALYGDRQAIALAGGEFVIRAPSVNAETRAMLDFINMHGDVPANDDWRLAVNDDWALSEGDDDRAVAGAFRLGGVVGDDDAVLEVPDYVHRPSPAAESAPIAPVSAPTPSASAATPAARQQAATLAAVLAELRALRVVAEQQRAEQTATRRLLGLFKHLFRKAA